MKASRGFLILSFAVVLMILFLHMPMLERFGLAGISMRHLQTENVTLTMMSHSTLSLQYVPVLYSKLKSGNMILYSAVATNSTQNTTWDIITVQGWVELKTKPNFGCCVLYSSGDTVSNYNVEIQYWYFFKRVKYGAMQIQFQLQKEVLGVPVKITVTDVDRKSKRKCDKNGNKYLTIDFAYKRAAMVVFLKVLYNQLSYTDLLAWFEIHKALGVDRVIGYVTDDLNENARVVLGHYQRTGLFEALYYPLLFKDKEEIERSSSYLSCTYRGVSMFDAQIRLAGYEYMVSIDADEYLLPTKSNESLRATFDRLFRKERRAAGFKFKTYLYIKDWGGNHNSPYSAKKYVLRSEPTNDRVKHVVIPNRVDLGCVRTHYFTPSAHFNWYYADIDDISLYHFRSCRSDMKGSRLCNRKVAVKDTKVLKMFKTVEDNINSVRKLYGL